MVLVVLAVAGWGKLWTAIVSVHCFVLRVGGWVGQRVAVGQGWLDEGGETVVCWGDFLS